MAEPFVDQLAADADVLLAVLEDRQDALAAQRSDDSFELTDAGFTSVVADQIGQDIFRKRELGSFQTVGFQLLLDQMVLGDIQFLDLGVGTELDDLETVSELVRDIVHVVRGRDEQDVGEIIGFFEIMVGEREVLFRVEDFQHGARGIAFVVGGHLVDLIDQEDRVERSRSLHALDDTARHGAEIGTAVTADLRFVTHAAQGDLDEFPVKRSGNGFRERRFTDARRTDETDDRALQAVSHLLDS